MSDILKIGRYQLENLIRTGIKFTFLDLRSAESRAESPLQGSTNDLLKSARSVEATEALNLLKSENAPPDAAVIVICEDGVKSKAVSEQLEQAGFMNVYRVEGGAAAL